MTCQRHKYAHAIPIMSTTSRALALSALLIGASVVAGVIPARATTDPNVGRLVARAFAWANTHSSVELSAINSPSNECSITMLLTPEATETNVRVSNYGTSSVIRVAQGHATDIRVSSLAQLSSLEVTTASVADENVWFTISPSDPRNVVLNNWAPLTVRSVFSYDQMVGFNRTFHYDGLTRLRGVRVYKLTTRSYIVNTPCAAPGPVYLYLTDTKVPHPFAGGGGKGAHTFTMYFTHWGKVAPIPVPTNAPPLPQ